MTQPFPADHVSVDVDIVETTACGFTVFNRATGTLHTITFDSIVIGPNAASDGYVLSLPRHRAILLELIDAA